MCHPLRDWWMRQTAPPDPAPPVDELDLSTPPPLDLSALTRWQADIERRVRYVETELATIRRESAPHGYRHRKSP